MKNSIVVFCSLLIVIVSCRKVDNSSVFNQSPDQRINAALAAYQTKLSGAQYGWRGAVETKAGGNFTFYFSFNDSNRVKMLSSYDSTSASILKESSYRLKALQQPSLLFDTYSYLHVLSDPNPSVNGGAAGSGLIADFEYYFDDANSTNDKITLIGRINSTKTILTRASQPERDSFLNGELARGSVISKLLTYYKRIIINGTDSTDVFISTRNSYMIQSDDNGNLLDDSKGTNYAFTLGGLALADTLTIGTKFLTELSNVNFDQTTNTITATNHGEPVIIKEVVVPMRVDVDAPRRWYDIAATNDDYPYWATFQGFHVNGVDDAYGLTSLPNYNFSVFYTKWDVVGNVTYDLFAPYFGAPLEYGAGFRPPTFSADGRITMRYFGTWNPIGSLPAGAPTTTLTSTRNKIADARGHYLVQLSNDPNAPLYHMVSAVDSKAWILWER